MKKFFRKLRKALNLEKNKLKDRKTHVYRECPHCHAILRLPKVTGTHGVSCPRCSMHFNVTVK